MDESAVGDCVAEIRRHYAGVPRLGVVLGTGSGGVAEQIRHPQRFAYQDLPGFVRSTATGHKGQMICGRLGQLETVAMQGRFHRYEGWSVAQTVFPLQVMIALGIQALVVTNAAGGLDPLMEIGDLVFLNSHIDLLTYHPGDPAGWADRDCPRPRVLGDAAYHSQWRETAQQVADCHHIRARSGVYVGLQGPNYETRAEYRMVRKMGGDVVGMSTVGEVMLASLHQIPVLAISVVTNVARPDAVKQTSENQADGHEGNGYQGNGHPTDGDEVVAAAEKVSASIYKVIHDSAHRFLS